MSHPQYEQALDEITSLELQLDILKKRNEKLEKVAEAARALERQEYFGILKQEHPLQSALQALDEVRK